MEADWHTISPAAAVGITKREEQAGLSQLPVICILLSHKDLEGPASLAHVTLGDRQWPQQSPTHSALGST